MCSFISRFLSLIGAKQDSFFKLLLDTWVRGIVTDSDNTLLILQTLYQAAFFEVAVLIFLVPVVSITYAVLFNAIYLIELKLPRTRFLVALETFSRHFNVSAYLVVIHGPPDTKKRQREAIDSLDGLWYWWHRKVRFVHFFYTTTSAALSYVLMLITVLALTIRLGCVWLCLARPIRHLFMLVGQKSTLELHERWFVGASGIIEGDQAAWAVAQHLRRLTQMVFYWMPEPAILGASWFAWTYVRLWILTTALILGTSARLVTERRDFKRRWKYEGGRERSLRFESHVHSHGHGHDDCHDHCQGAFHCGSHGGQSHGSGHGDEVKGDGYH